MVKYLYFCCLACKTYFRVLKQGNLKGLKCKCGNRDLKTSTRSEFDTYHTFGGRLNKPKDIPKCSTGKPYHLKVTKVTKQKEIIKKEEK